MVADAEIPIIHPPPEVKNIVDKTAGFVARNGVEFETRIKQVNVPRKKTLLSLALFYTVMPCHNHLKFSFNIVPSRMRSTILSSTFSILGTPTMPTTSTRWWLSGIS